MLNLFQHPNAKFICMVRSRNKFGMTNQKLSNVLFNFNNYQL